MTHLITTGVVGMEDLLLHLKVSRHAAGPFTLTELVEDRETIHDLFEGLRDRHEAGIPLVIQLQYQWDKTELKEVSYKDSQVFRDVQARLVEIAEAARNYPSPVYFVGYEHGLGFVPMQDHHREDIRRSTELQAAIMPHLDSYQIMFSGLNPLTVFTDRLSTRSQPCPVSSPSIA